MRRFARDAVLLVLAVCCLFGWSAISTAYGASLSGSEVTDRGVAVARNCDFGGPFGGNSPGWWWTCTADVRWEKAGTAEVVFHHSQLTGEDVGEEVQVVQRRITKGAGKGFDDVPYRADFEPRPLVGNLLGIPLLLVGALILLSFALRLWSGAKHVFSGNR